MAERRMMSRKIVDSDAFMDMPLSAQALYFHLLSRADDDGFVGNPKKIMRMVGANEDDYKVLIGKRFVLVFPSGVCVIKHWLIHNYIQKDRYNETQYLDEKTLIKQKENKAYTECIQDVSSLETQVSIGKVSIDKISIEQENRVAVAPTPQKRFSKPSLDEVKAYCIERKNTVHPQRFIDHYESNGWKVGRNPMKDWKASVRTWERSSYENNTFSKKPDNVLQTQHSNKLVEAMQNKANKNK